MKTIISHFLTTVNFSMVWESFLNLTIRIPFLRNWKEIDRFNVEFLNYLWLKNSKIINFYTCRSAIFHWLKLLGIRDWDEVLVSSYTCVSVVNAVIQTGAIPVYIDIDDSFNINPSLIEAKITPKTKAIIIQHTFGKPAAINEILDITSRHNIKVMEDCAITMWATYFWQKVWVFWDVSVFSLGRDKVISTVNWGILVINNKQFFNKINEIKSNLINQKTWEILKNYEYIKLAYFAYKTYDFIVWKIVLEIAKKFKLFPEILTKKEKNCEFKDFYYKYPNSLAYIARKELSKLDKYNSHRIQLVNLYKKELAWIVEFATDYEWTKDIWYMFSLRTNKAPELLKFAKSRKILIGNYWFWLNIAPCNTNIDSTWYSWDCPNAEKLSHELLQLPTHPWVTISDAQRVINTIKEFYDSNK